MNAYLVGTSCFEYTAGMGITLVPRDYAVVSNGVFAVLLSNAHLFAVVGVSSDRRVYCAGFLFDVAPYYSLIFPCKGMLLDLFGKSFVRL